MSRTNEYKYTFLLPAYKGRYLSNMLYSIQQQTYKSYKVIISDDCSPEDLFSICKPFLDDSRFEYRRNETNIGAEHLVDHWNMLLSLCDSEYCIFASDDDVYEPFYLEDMDNLIMKFPNRAAYRPMVRIVDSFLKEVQTDDIMEGELDIRGYFRLLHSQSLSSGFPFYVFKVSLLRKIGGVVYFPYAWYSDDATTAQMIEIGNLVVSNRVSFLFRLSEYNITGSNSVFHTVRCKIKSGSMYYSFLKTKGIPKESLECVKEMIRKSGWISTTNYSSLFSIAIVFYGYSICREVYSLGWIKSVLWYKVRLLLNNINAG